MLWRKTVSAARFEGVGGSIFSGMFFLLNDHLGIDLSFQMFVRLLSVEAGHGQVVSRSFYPFRSFFSKF